MKALFIFISALLMAYPAFADTGMRVVVPVRDIARGETLSESDVSYAFVDPANVMPGTATAMESVVGRQTRRVLRTGLSMRNDDVRAPVLVTKGATVTMIFDAPGITLMATGRAMSEGGMGETVTVQNPASYRQITAVVTGPGAVKALTGMGSVSQRVASARP
jgi:flagella basal body P-ring formation protein FlgA